MSKLIPTSKDGLRFDWYPILQADFIDDLAAEVMATVEAARTSTRGSSKAAAEERTQQLIIAKHLLSALYCAYSTISSKKAPTRISVIKKTNGFSTDKTKYPTRIHYSFRYFIDVYKALEQLNQRVLWQIEECLVSHYEYGFATTDKFCSHFRNMGYDVLLGQLKDIQSEKQQ